MSAVLRFRLTIGEDVVLDELVGQAADVEHIALVQAERAIAAAEEDAAWLLEVIDPDGVVPTVRIVGREA